MVKLGIGVIGLGAIAYAIVSSVLWFGQARLIFFPQPAPVSTPADAGLAYEDVWIPVGEGHIHGWWLPATDPNAKTVLILHGNASNVEGALYKASYFLAAGLSALVIDYRGYGLSSGPFPNEAQVYEDAAAAWTYLTETREIPDDSILVFGHSIGGAIAIDLIQSQPQAAGLIVESTFTSMSAMMDHIGYSRLFPKRLLNQKFDSYSKIKNVEVPVLFIHGLEDETVPFQMTQDLHNVANEPKELWLVPDANHNNVASVNEQRYFTILHSWLVQQNMTSTKSQRVEFQ